MNRHDAKVFLRRIDNGHGGIELTLDAAAERGMVAVVVDIAASGLSRC